MCNYSNNICLYTFYQNRILTINQPKLPKRFLSDLIIKGITSIFFLGELGSLGTRESTKYIFNPLTGDIIILVYIILKYAIKEYEQGKIIRIKFEGEYVKSKLNSVPFIPLDTNNNRYRVIDRNKRAIGQF